MTVPKDAPTYADTNTFIEKGMKLKAVTTKFDLTAGKIYVATKNQGENTFYNCVYVKNDKGEEKAYANKYFCKP